MAAVAAPQQHTGAASAAPLAAILSPSQVRTFTGCQAAWWFRYGLRLPDPKTSGRALGSAVDEAIMYDLGAKIETGCDLPLGEVLSEYHEAWKSQAEDTEFREDEDPRALEAQGEQLVRTYMQHAAPQVKPVACQLEVEGAIAGVRVQGRVDVLEASGRIIDIKTAAKSPNGVDDAAAFQLATYVALTPQASGVTRIDTLVKSKTPKYVPQTRTLGPRHAQLVETIYPLAQDAMRSGLYLPNRSSMLCSRRQCAYWRACEREFGGEVNA